MNVLFVNHNLSKFCGIYAHGVRMANILNNSQKHNFIYTECSSVRDLYGHVKIHKPKAIIYNYTNGLLPWADDAVAFPGFLGIQQLAMCHDVVQMEIDMGEKLGNFDYRIALDPTLKTNSRWFKSVRPLFGYKNTKCVKNEIPTIGSFGFYFPHKNFGPTLVSIVEQFKGKRCKVRFHITKAHFSSDHVKNELDQFKLWAYSYVAGTGVDLQITSEYMDDKDQIDFLAGNDLNIFFYSMNYGSGPSSAIDYAVAAGKPIMISESYQFNHIRGRLPTMMTSSMQEAIDAGNSEVLKLQEEWSEQNFLKDYERIIDEVQNRW